MQQSILIAGAKENAGVNLARDYNHVVNVAQLRGKGYRNSVRVWV